jgi:hypothetical protein
MVKQTDVNEFARRAQEALAQAQRSLSELLAAQAMRESLRLQREAELRELQVFIFEQIAHAHQQPVPGAVQMIVDAPTRFARRVRRRRNLV